MIRGSYHGWNRDFGRTQWMILKTTKRTRIKFISIERKSYYTYDWLGAILRWEFFITIF